MDVKTLVIVMTLGRRYLMAQYRRTIISTESKQTCILFFIIAIQ